MSVCFSGGPSLCYVTIISLCFIVSVAQLANKLIGAGCQQKESAGTGRGFDSVCVQDQGWKWNDTGRYATPAVPCLHFCTCTTCSLPVRRTANTDHNSCKCTLTASVINFNSESTNKKLSYRKETVRLLHLSLIHI